MNEKLGSNKCLIKCKGVKSSCWIPIGAINGLHENREQWIAARANADALMYVWDANTRRNPTTCDEKVWNFELTRTLSMLWGGRRKFTIVWSSHPLNYCEQKSKLEISKKLVATTEFLVHVREYPKNDPNFSLFCRELFARGRRCSDEVSTTVLLPIARREQKIVLYICTTINV